MIYIKSRNYEDRVIRKAIEDQQNQIAFILSQNNNVWPDELPSQEEEIRSAITFALQEILSDLFYMMARQIADKNISKGKSPKLDDNKIKSKILSFDLYYQHQNWDFEFIIEVNEGRTINLVEFWKELLCEKT